MSAALRWSDTIVAADRHVEMLTRAGLDLCGGIAPMGLTAPHIIPIPCEWNGCRKRILYIGQETRDCGPPGCDTLEQAMVDPADAIRKIAADYIRFDLGSEDNHRFWREHRLVADTLADGNRHSVLWLNVVCVARNCAPHGMFSNLTWDEVGRIASWQRGRLTEEIRELDPSVAIFVSGPNYDYYLEREFEGIVYERISECDHRQLARLRHCDLPYHSYRTYHPNARVRGRDKLINAIFDVSSQAAR